MSRAKKNMPQNSTKKGTHVKEVKFRLFTGEHDLDFKIKHARDFLSSGNKVKTTLMFRGREMAYQQKGREIMAQILQQLQDVGAPENPPRMEGNSMVMLLIPKLTKESK